MGLTTRILLFSSKFATLPDELVCMLLCTRTITKLNKSNTETASSLITISILLVPISVAS